MADPLLAARVAEGRRERRLLACISPMRVVQVYNSRCTDERTVAAPRSRQRAVRPGTVFPGRAARARVRRGGPARSAATNPRSSTCGSAAAWRVWMRRTRPRMVGISCMHALEYDRVLETARRSPARGRRTRSSSSAATRRRHFPGRCESPRSTPSAWTTARRSCRPSPMRSRPGGPCTTVPALLLNGRGRVDRDAAARGPHGPGRRPDAGPRSGRARPQALPLPPLQPGLARRDGARLPLPLQLLLGVAALRTLVPRALDRRRRGRPRVRRATPCSSRTISSGTTRSGAASSRAALTPRGREEALDPGPDAHGHRGAPPRSAGGVAADREGLRHLLRPRGGLGRGAGEHHEGRDGVLASIEAARVARSMGYGVTGNFLVDPDWDEAHFQRALGLRRPRTASSAPATRS